MADDLVTIATFLNLGEAKLAQGKLSAAGIDASVRDENAMNLHIGMAMWGIKLQVPDPQVVRALEILDDFRATEPEEDGDAEVVRCCPECESPTAQGQHWRCLACGHQWEEENDH